MTGSLRGVSEIPFIVYIFIFPACPSAHQCRRAEILQICVHTVYIRESRALRMSSLSYLESLLFESRFLRIKVQVEGSGQFRNTCCSFVKGTVR
jgi:hypothetical protein